MSPSIVKDKHATESQKKKKKKVHLATSLISRFFSLLFVRSILFMYTNNRAGLILSSRVKVRYISSAFKQ